MKVKKEVGKQNLPSKRLRELGVVLVYLFGSRAEEVAGPLSDTDIGVVFGNPQIVSGDTREIYNTLYEIFSEALGSTNIDVVLLERANLELQFDVITHGKILFTTSENFQQDFEHRITMLYADFKPTLNNFDRSVLSRVA